MPRKLALKRLTASDLTLFRWHYQNKPAGKQKAFNLDARILVDVLFPQLAEQPAVLAPRFPLDLYFIGPDGAQPHNLQRKILKQKKNWRLNGELIQGPEEAPDRYNCLEPGDFAILDFVDSPIPVSARVLLVSQTSPGDKSVHQALQASFPAGSMRSLEEKDLAHIIANAEPPESHPIRDLILADVMEDAALGGAESIAKVAQRGSGRGASPAELLRSKEAADRTGLLGEEILNRYFERQQEKGRMHKFKWISRINAVSPFDFVIKKSPRKKRRLAEAKSTAGSFSNPIHMSLGELRRAVAGPEKYDVYRLFEVSVNGARCKVCRDAGPQLSAILAHLEKLPDGVRADSVSIKPEVLAFSTREWKIRSPRQRNAAAGTADIL